MLCYLWNSTNILQLQYWFHKMGQIFYQWLACVNAGQPVISPGASPARQAQNWSRPAHEMGSSPHTVRARKIYPPKAYLGLHPVYCVTANMDAVNHVSSRRAGQARSGHLWARQGALSLTTFSIIWTALSWSKRAIIECPYVYTCRSVAVLIYFCLAI